jgi:UDP-glucose 6-dehydrogenase
MTYVMAVAKDIARTANDYIVIVTKSTVPIGTNRKVKPVVQMSFNGDPVLATVIPFSRIKRPTRRFPTAMPTSFSS